MNEKDADDGNDSRDDSEPELNAEAPASEFEADSKNDRAYCANPDIEDLGSR